MEEKQVPIDVQLNQTVSQQVERNREKLKPIVEAVILCGRQNIPLRGHRDDSKYWEENRTNSGNLQEILKYLVSCGKNEVVEEHFNNAPKNATCGSKTTQNQLIDICGEIIKENIIEEIKKAKYFSILADEAADISNIEQMLVVIRFVDQHSVIREEFLSFIPCKLGLSGESIAKTLIETMTKLDLNMTLCHSQGYDGAGNMAGICSGAAVRIQQQFPKANYVHCGSHLLNLCVASACNIQVVQNMMNHVRVVSQFFNAHPKRFDLLQTTVKELLPGACHSHLIDICRTR